jgi:hypothetical protein
MLSIIAADKMLAPRRSLQLRDSRRSNVPAMQTYGTSQRYAVMGEW